MGRQSVRNQAEWPYCLGRVQSAIGLLLQLAITDLQVWIFRIDLLYISARRRFLYFVI